MPEYNGPIQKLDHIENADALEHMRSIPDKSVDLILLDPPYGATKNKWDIAPEWPVFWHEFKRLLSGPKCPVVITSQLPYAVDVIASNRAWYKYEWVWQKTIATGHLDAANKPLRAHELVLVFAQSAPVYNAQLTAGTPYVTKRGRYSSNYGSQRTTTTINNGTRNPTTVLTYQNERGLHPTQKPAPLFEFLIKTYTEPGGVVLDPFMGSGTTALAAWRTNRHYVGSESSAKYHKIAVDRLANCDPLTAKEYPDGKVQLSLFDNGEGL